jgi:hypothetical protein
VRGGASCMIKSKKGLTMVEAVASIFITTIVLAASLTLLFQIRRQSTASQERLLAHQISLLVFDSITRSNYNDVSLWLDESNGKVTMDNCYSSPIDCSIFSYELNNKIYKDITIQFEAQDKTAIDLKIIKYQISIVYFQDRQLQLDGVLYG